MGDLQIVVTALVLELQQNVADNAGAIDYERFEADALAVLKRAQEQGRNEDRGKLICPYSLLPCKFSTI